MSTRTPTCVWPISDELVTALDDRLGEPTDAYVNGSQVWLRPDGPGDLMLEWRLHPVAGFERPEGTTALDLLSTVALALSEGGTPPAPATSLWDGLEVFPAYGEEIEPVPLQALTAEILGIEAPYAGLVDHQIVGDEWEQSGGQISIVAELIRQLAH